jgi:transposase
MRPPDLDTPLATMRILKEDLRRFREFGSRKDAGAAIGEFVRRARAFGAPEIASRGNAVGWLAGGLLNRCGDPACSGPPEGLNNKAKAEVRLACGHGNIRCSGFRSWPSWKSSRTCRGPPPPACARRAGNGVAAP